MKVRKTQKILSRLNKFELNKLEAFLLSPFFNTEEQIVNIYRRLRDTPQIKSNVLWEKIYPGKKYEDIALRLLISNLNQLIEQFLAINHIIKSPVLIETQIASVLNNKELLTFALKHLEGAKSNFKKIKERNNSFYLQQFQMEELRTNLLAKKQERSSLNTSQKLDEYLDLFYLINKLKYCCEYLNHKNIFSKGEAPLFMSETIEIVSNSKYLDVPAISIYYNILMTLNDNSNETYFTELKHLLIEHQELFALSDVRLMYGYAQNYCIKKINEGDLNYLDEIFKIYKLVLSKKIILVDDTISPWDYKNIISVALRLNKTEWALKFIKKYKTKILDADRHNAYHFNIARYYFKVKRYKLTLKNLQKVVFNDVFYSLDTKALLLKTYYELGEQAALFSLIDSFRVQLRRNKVLSKKHIASFLNLITFIRQLSTISNKDKLTIQKLKNKVSATKEIADLGWLNQKIEEFQKK